MIRTRLFGAKFKNTKRIQKMNDSLPFIEYEDARKHLLAVKEQLRLKYGGTIVETKVDEPFAQMLREGGCFFIEDLEDADRVQMKTALQTYNEKTIAAGKYYRENLKDPI